jgi:dipeptidyl aminopeptidase/acylaminoacyl peptidase
MKLRARVSSAALLFVAIGFPAGAQQQEARRGITAEDYFSYRFAADPRISPDGKQVAYVVSRVDRARNRRVPSIWITSTEGAATPRELVGEAWTPGAPRWSPDGRTIAFSSGRVSIDSAGTTGRQEPPPGRSQLWTVPSAGGSPRRLTNITNGVSNCSWSPQGDRFVCLVRTGPSDSVNTGSNRSDVRHYTHISYKFNDTGWFDDRRSHLSIIDAGRERNTTRARRGMSGRYPSREANQR